jgi:hypothetical protein
VTVLLGTASVCPVCGGPSMVKSMTIDGPDITAIGFACGCSLADEQAREWAKRNSRRALSLAEVREALGRKAKP